MGSAAARRRRAIVAASSLSAVRVAASRLTDFRVSPVRVAAFRVAAFRVSAFRAFRVAAFVVTALVVAGCTGVADLHIPTPPSLPPGAAATTTVVSDLTGAALPTVPIPTPPKVLLVPGKASLTGTVTGPSGVVAGATVLVERLVGAGVGSTTVPTQPDGTWKVTGILGGLYRIRAWHVPDLDLITPQIVLLAPTDNTNVNLTLLPYSGQSLSATISPAAPLVGQVTTLVVLASQQAVGSDGIIRATPLAGANIFVLAAGDVVLAGTNPGTSDSSGRIVLSLGCSSIGPVGLSAVLNGFNTFPLTVPDCTIFVPPPSTTTPTTRAPKSSTTTAP
jgi:hypothetical protein